MTTYEILNKVPLTLSEVKSKISAIKKRDIELNFRSNKVEEYISSFHLLSQKDSKEAYDKLEKLEIARLKDIHIKKLIDILPEKDDEVKSVLISYNISLTSENIKKILDALKEYIPSKK